jgi:hypothetical protein
MAKRKLVAVLVLATVAVAMLAGSSAHAQATTTLRAAGMLIDGTGTTLGQGQGILTVPDGDDADALPDPVGGKLIEFWVGDTQLVCDEFAATTDPSGVGRCGLLLNETDPTLVEVIANLGYTVKFAGDDDFSASEDHGGLIWVSQVPADIP